MHLVRPLREAAYPLLVASQAIPVVVLAPLFVLAFDYGIGPKLAIVALICFFPITVNLLDGLRSVEPELLGLMRSLGSSRLRHARARGAAGGAALPLLGPARGRHGVGDRRRVRRVGGRRRGPRPARAARQQPAPDAAGLRGVVLLTLLAVALFALVSLLERVLRALAAGGGRTVRALRLLVALCALALGVAAAARRRSA